MRRRLEQDQPHIFDPDAGENNIPPEFIYPAKRIKAVLTLTHTQRKLLADMLRIRPNDCIKSQDILNHVWFQQQETSS